MWPRARRLPDSQDAPAFVWGGAIPDLALEALHAAGRADDPSHARVDVEQVERDAYRRGLAEGEAAGAAAEATRQEGALARLGLAVDQLASARAEMIHATEHQMVELALAIARRIVLREVGLDRDLLVAMAHVALQRLERGAVVTVRLHPADYAATVDAQTARWAGSPVTVSPDQTIPRGGCRIESAFGHVDAGVDAQLQEVGLALLGAPEGESRPDA